MAIGFPIVPTLPSASAIFGASLPNIPSLPTIPLPGIPPIRTFPGAAQIVGSIQGNVLTVTQGIDAIAPGLSLSGVGLDPSTLIAGPLQSIEGGIGTALLNVQGSVSNIAMQAVGSINLGSLGDSLGDISSLLSGDVGDLLDGLDGPSGGDVPGWGIFLDGVPVLHPNSVLAADVKKDWHISDYPVEEGNFESYNKVRIPYDARLTMTKERVTASELTAFLSELDAAAASLDLYTVVTPDVQYANANIVHYDYSRTTQNGGVSRLVVSVWVQEVRVEASSTFTQTADAAGADPIRTGVVQAVQATAQQVQTFAKGIVARGF